MSHCHGNSSFQDVSFKWDQMVVGKVGDIRFCVLITHICFHWQKLCSVLVPANKTKGTLRGRQDPRFGVNSLYQGQSVALVKCSYLGVMQSLVLC